MERAYSHCKAVEIPHPTYVPEHDDFADNLQINYDDIEPADVIRHALALIGKTLITPIDTSGMEFVPELRYGKA